VIILTLWAIAAAVGG